MNLEERDESAERFAAYVDGLASVIGHADRIGPLRDYCTGLTLPGERKSVEPIAARTAPGRTAAQHQSLLHFIGVAEWSDARVLGKVREMVLPVLARHGPIEAWIIDDTAFPKQGRHSVGVQHQYCGQLGKPGELSGCGVAVACQSPWQPAGGVSALSAEGLDHRPGAAEEGGRPRERKVQDQAGDCARAGSLGLRSRASARGRADGCRLWQ